MGFFDKPCYFCINKPGFLSTGYICKLTGKELDQKSDLFQYGCHGSPSSAHKYCPKYTEDK